MQIVRLHRDGLLDFTSASNMCNSHSAFPLGSAYLYFHVEFPCGFRFHLVPLGGPLIVDTRVDDVPKGPRGPPPPLELLGHHQPGCPQPMGPSIVAQELSIPHFVGMFPPLHASWLPMCTHVKLNGRHCCSRSTCTLLVASWDIQI